MSHDWDHKLRRRPLSSYYRGYYEVAVANASFVEVFTAAAGAGDAVERTTLYVSSFNPENILGTDKVYRVPAPGRQLDAVSDWQLQLLDHNAYWTNDIDYMAPQAVGFEGVIVTSGYLGTFHTHGKLQVFNTETSPPSGPYLLSMLDVHDWAYRRAVWHDMDADGDLDLLAARFNKKELAHTPLKSLAFMINEGTPVDGIWRQKDVVEGGPDAGLRVARLTSAGVPYDVVVAGEMWNERLALYWSETGDRTDPASVRSRVVDNTTGSIFDVFYSDLNGDGAPEVWATAYDHAADSDAVYAWTVPEDFAAGDWRRVTIADGFRAAEAAVGERVSPGEAVAFHPSRAARAAGEKPLILLSAVAAADLDGDGFTELLAAGHTAGSLAVFSYGPQ
ncbi:hypothetical protein FJT64_026819 [Amphibalanus amphitrite]|uniref:VCBS repeat-containing protein n=1 Tax=Amphibalanus amphitrite TaxID=1232801 RepID=A0A6A4W464_AMPAM|nr:hypothetical protein FJT64_026819 [Amphibalanus amphitrite]